MAANQRQAIHQAIDVLSDESVQALKHFVGYLLFKEQQDKDWFEKVYDLFAPVREAAVNMTEDEINQIIAESIEEVRREHETTGGV